MTDGPTIPPDNISLPKGSIVRRIIRGKERFYHQWRENGKTLSRYLKPCEIIPLREAIENRKASTTTATATFHSGILTGRRLDELAASVRHLGTSSLLTPILDTLHTESANTDSRPPEGLLLVEGLPGSGKTTLLRQALAALTSPERKTCAYLSLPTDLDSHDLLTDLYALADMGITRFLLDGLDRSATYRNICQILEDTCVATGLRIVATAATPHPLTVTAHTRRLSTTALSFIDWHARHKSGNLEDYLRTAGPTVSQIDVETRHVAEALNGHHLLRILTTASHERRLGSIRLVHDLNKITRRLAERLPAAPSEAELERLKALNITASAEDETFIILPGLRQSLSIHSIRKLLEDDVAAHLGAAERKLVEETVMRLVTDRTLADIVLWETQRRKQGPKTDVFRVRFPSGGYDIVVADREELTCELYEVRLATERNDRQLANLTNVNMLDTIEHRYGTIVQRTLVYLGRNAWHNSGVAYRNATHLLENE